MTQKQLAGIIVSTFALLTLASAARAQQTPVMDYRWSVDVGLGRDNAVSGNINSGATGTLDGVSTTVLRNTYKDVYGTGLHLRLGVGYLIDEISEVRGAFSYQSREGALTPLGDYGIAPLYGQFDPYKVTSLDGGFRRYFDFEARPKMRAYVEGTIGLAFVSSIDLSLSAPAANPVLDLPVTPFFDGSTSVRLGGHAGVLWQGWERVAVFGQVGLRWTSGLSEVDEIPGTGLDAMNDATARWTLPILGGVRVRF